MAPFRFDSFRLWFVIGCFFLSNENKKRFAVFFVWFLFYDGSYFSSVWFVFFLLSRNGRHFLFDHSLRCCRCLFTPICTLTSTDAYGCGWWPQAVVVAVDVVVVVVVVSSLLCVRVRVSLRFSFYFVFFRSNGGNDSIFQRPEPSTCPRNPTHTHTKLGKTR